MKLNRHIGITLGLLTCALLSAPAQAANLTYEVSVDTSSLVGNVNAPFSLDFQMNYGSGPFGNNATISNFSYGGGSADGTPNLFGTAAGNIGSTVTLSDDNAHFSNEIYQGFTPGTKLTFDVTLSNNTTILTPDGLIFTILDQTLGSIPTTQPTGSAQDGTDGSALAIFSIGGKGAVDQKIDVSSYRGANNPALGGDYSTVTVVVVPEPSSWALAGICVALFAYLRRRAATPQI